MEKRVVFGIAPRRLAKRLIIVLDSTIRDLNLNLSVPIISQSGQYSLIPKYYILVPRGISKGVLETIARLNKRLVGLVICI